MKRTDLREGTDYLMHPSNDWKSSPYSAKRVTVVSLQGVKIPRGYGSRAHHDFDLYDGTKAEQVWAYPGGPDVLVRHENGDVQAVRTATLRGEWETAKAEMDETTRLRNERELRQRRAEQAEAERVASIRDRISAMGLTPGYLYANGGTLRGLNMSAVEALLDLAEECGRRRDEEFVEREANAAERARELAVCEREGRHVLTHRHTRSECSVKG